MNNCLLIQLAKTINLISNEHMILNKKISNIYKNSPYFYIFIFTLDKFIIRLINIINIKHKFDITSYVYSKMENQQNTIYFIDHLIKLTNVLCYITDICDFNDVLLDIECTVLLHKINMIHLFNNYSVCKGLNSSNESSNFS